MIKSPGFPTLACLILFCVAGGLAQSPPRENEPNGGILETGAKKPAGALCAEAEPAAEAPRHDDVIAERLVLWSLLNERGGDPMAYLNEINALDADELKRCLLVSGTMADPPLVTVIDLFVRLARKSPEDATKIGLPLVNSSPKFNAALADCVGDAFATWLALAPAEADAWYRSALEAGELVPKSSPGEGDARFAPNRNFPAIRFQAALGADLYEAESMAASLHEEDFARVLGEIREPVIVARFVRLLSPDLQGTAAKRAASDLAAKELAAAATWINQLEISDAARDSLRVEAIQTAHRLEEIDLDGVVEQAKAMGVLEESLPNLYYSAAIWSRLQDGVGWDPEGMDGILDWLRANFPGERVEIAVGRFIGGLGVYEFENSIALLERQTAGPGTLDKDLISGFADALCGSGGEKRIAELLGTVEAMPASRLREALVAEIKARR